MLRDQPPPVPTAELTGRDVHDRSLTFRAIAGDPLGPKYPDALSVQDINDLVAIGRALDRYDVRRRWLRRLDSGRRIEVAQRVGLLTGAIARALADVARREHRRLTFAHGDLTARNVLADTDGRCVLIDWEWAGLYPPEYDLAFLWFSLVDMPGGRAQVEAAVVGKLDSFLLSALLVQLWHLQWFVPVEFHETHLATRDDLVRRLVDR